MSCAGDPAKAVTVGSAPSPSQDRLKNFLNFFLQSQTCTESLVKLMPVSPMCTAHSEILRIKITEHVKLERLK